MKKLYITGALAALVLCSCAPSGTAISLTEISRSAETEEIVSSLAVSKTDETTIPDICIVYVCGAVVSPGVYELTAGSRIVDALNLAGGITEEGAPTAVNLAEPVYDGEQIYIPTWTEISEGYTVPANTGEASAKGLININRATKEELMTLSGIGESKAEAIIRYRETNGDFSTIEDLMEVNGIGQSSFEMLKDYITVD